MDTSSNANDPTPSSSPAFPGARAKAKAQPSPPGPSSSFAYDSFSERGDPTADIVVIELFAGVGTASQSIKEHFTDKRIATYIIENDDKDPSKFLARCNRRRDPHAIIWEDVNDLITENGRLLLTIMAHHMASNPDVHFIFPGGFPCQDLSSAGHQEGLTGSRSRLFAVLAVVIAIAQTVAPEQVWYIAENVASMKSESRTMSSGDLAGVWGVAEVSAANTAGVNARHSSSGEGFMGWAPIRWEDGTSVGCAEGRSPSGEPQSPKRQGAREVATTGPRR